MCVLEQFHQRLRRRDIHATTSSRWADRRARLLTGDVWDEQGGTILNALNLPSASASFLSQHSAKLDTAWRSTAATSGPDAAFSIDDDGRVHAKRLDALDDPPSLVALRRQCEAMLPRVDIGELILEVMSWHPEFVNAFTSIANGEPQLGDLSTTVAAALTAQALNIGYTPVVSSTIPALTRDRISHVEQNYLRAETFAAANAALIEAQAGIELARQWGGGLVAAVDGIRFVVPVRTVNARPNPKYFGRRRGATWLNLVNDQAAGLAGIVLAGTPRDSLHMIDLLYRQDAGQRPTVIVTDTGSYSDMVFALLHLLGFDYRPQLADIPDAKLWRIDRHADYGPLNPAARGRIDLERITRHWPDLTRIAASIHTGAVSAHDIIRMLTPAGKPTQLGEALAHYGRIFKTTHVLAYLTEPSLT